MLVPALAGVINVFASSPIFVVSTRLRAAAPGQHRDTCPIPPYISPISPPYSPIPPLAPGQYRDTCPISPYISLIPPLARQYRDISPTAPYISRISLASHHAPGQYRDAMHCLRETLAEGAASLWSGLVPVSHTRLQPRTSKAWLELGLG